jgi:hypothetical protein
MADETKTDDFDPQTLFNDMQRLVTRAQAISTKVAKMEFTTDNSNEIDIARDNSLALFLAGMSHVYDIGVPLSLVVTMLGSLWCVFEKATADNKDNPSQIFDELLQRAFAHVPTPKNVKVM